LLTGTGPGQATENPDGKPVIYGRISYRDIFGRVHSDGFIQNAAQPITPPHASYIESDPEWDLPKIGRRLYQEEEPQN
jgi:hypothetical protein